MLVDNDLPLETAEGIEISVTPAGLAVRSMAFTLDLLIRAGIVVAASLVLQLLGQMGVGLMLIVVFLVEWLYPVFFELLWGATPGKRNYGLRVTYDNGLPVTLPGSLIRNLFRSIDILPFAYLTGFFCLLSSAQSKRVGDLLAGTLVIYDDNRQTLAPLEENAEQIEQVNLSLEQQQAIILYAERCSQLSPQRQQELANYLSPITGCENQAAVDKLKSIAASLVGKA